MTRDAMGRQNYFYRRVKLLPELSDRGPMAERRTNLREHSFRLSFGDKVSDNNMLCHDAPVAEGH
jgi:hypothetical protein